MQVPNMQSVTTVAPSQDVMNERWRHLTETVDGIAKQMPSMATRDYLDEKLEELAKRMVGRGEFDRLQWEHEKLTADMERLAKETQDALTRQGSDFKERLEDNSPRRLWGNLTTIVSGLMSIIALLVALGVIKPK